MPPENNLRPTTNDRRQDSGDSLKQIRTFQGDVADALGRNNESLASIQAAEAAKRRENPYIEAAEASDGVRRNAFYLLGGAAFLILGGLASWYGYQTYLEKTAPPVIAAPANRFILPESTREVDALGATRETLLSHFETALEGIGGGELRHLVMRLGNAKESALLSTPDFMLITESRAPGSLVRALEPMFMAGALGQHRFLIFKIISYSNAFSGMLAWEPDLPQDLGALLLPEGEMKSIDSASVFFNDLIVKNKDVRLFELSLASSTERLAYSFLGNEMLVITDSVEALETLLERLTREKLSR